MGLDRKIDILLGSRKNIESVNVDNFEKVNLSKRVSEFVNHDIFSKVNSAEVFDYERELNSVYRIYGRIEYLSMLNGLKNNYKDLKDFYTIQKEGSYNLLNSFNFYLVKPALVEYAKMNGTSQSANVKKYIRRFEVIATPDDFEIYPVGFCRNVYGEQVYAFNFTIDFDISDSLDYLGFPITEFFLFPYYITRTNGNGSQESLSGTSWNVDGTVSRFALPPASGISFSIGDVLQIPNGLIISDVIECDEKNFRQEQIGQQFFYIKTQCIDYSAQSINLVWKYNPFIPFKLRYFSDVLNGVNTGSTSYDDLVSVPYYAKLIESEGNYVWRDILPQGYKDPITGVCVNYPFLNNKRYLFSPITFSVVPDMSDAVTSNAFKNVWFDRNATEININIRSSNDLNKIGKPCA